MILILTDQFDRHADLVAEHLSDAGSHIARMNLDTASLRQTRITACSINNWTVDLGSSGTQFKTSDISVVWLRRPFVELNLEEQAEQNTDSRIWRGEWNKSLLGMYLSLRDIPWLNPIRSAYRSENKYLQMLVAKELGLNLPSTIVSNDRTQLIDFAEEHGNVMLKLMNQEFYCTGPNEYKGLFANKITALDLDDFSGPEENPVVLQKYIEKDYEVRYTVVGEEHYVCKIESQKSAIAKDDWRRYDIANTPHTQIAPPPHINEAVTEFMKRLELPFGALDFIVTPSGDWYFLEVNPMGQWLWIEDLTGLRISQSIATWLTKRERRS